MFCTVFFYEISQVRTIINDKRTSGAADIKIIIITGMKYEKLDRIKRHEFTSDQWVVNERK